MRCFNFSSYVRVFAVAALAIVVADVAVVVVIVVADAAVIDHHRTANCASSAGKLKIERERERDGSKKKSRHATTRRNGHGDTEADREAWPRVYTVYK